MPVRHSLPDMIAPFRERRPLGQRARDLTSARRRAARYRQTRAQIRVPPEVVNTIPLAMTGPPGFNEPPLLATPFTVSNSRARLNSHSTMTIGQCGGVHSKNAGRGTSDDSNQVSR